MTAHEAFLNWASPCLMIGCVLCVMGVVAILSAAIVAYSAGSYGRR